MLIPLGLAVFLLLSPALEWEEVGRHKLYVTYGNLAVERNLAVLRIRIFKDDLETALAAHSGRETVVMEASPEFDALFAAYFAERFTFEVAGESLTGRIIGSGEDQADREPVWWYQIRFDAPAPIRSARIVNTVLFESFDDQRNILKVVHFPDETPRTFYFARGEESREIRF